MLAGGVVYSAGEKEGSDSRNTLREEPTGFTINWMCSEGGLAPCRRANSLASHASPASVLSLTAHICFSPLGSNLPLGLNLLLLNNSQSHIFQKLTIDSYHSLKRIVWVSMR